MLFSVGKKKFDIVIDQDDVEDCEETCNSNIIFLKKVKFKSVFFALKQIWNSGWDNKSEGVWVTYYPLLRKAVITFLHGYIYGLQGTETFDIDKLSDREEYLFSEE